ncbi:hypothetical protein BWD42_24125 [Sphingobacterium sp. CZ-UAM]|uniref:FimB/Mfa2 family fimbrial subunit n=1 Tax=Sphingobacterium sp. CZ-UAM TaxID=1933868 RepID=UPI000986C431|nr:FimB/Mfa2 family fimbrial subunit [Sphingobacterium sp. CZ-UAM]OOG15769.1 hypothetical protein BWD42_24125 [Sphingobacterium sp. CZ-UAM]
MKLIISIVYNLSIVLMFIGCSKHAPEPENNLYVVKFKAVGFTQSIKDFGEGSPKVASVNNESPKSSKLISHLHFVIFDSQGKMVQTISQDTLKTINFGEVEVKLPIGSYRIAVVGASDYSNGPFGGHRMFMPNLEEFRILYMTQIETGYHVIKHAFCSELLNFEVNNSGGVVVKELLLTRVSSQLDLVFENVIPVNTHRVLLEIPSTVDYYFFRQQNNENTKLQYYKNLENAVGKSGIKITVPLFSGVTGVNSPKSLKMYFYDNNNTLFLTRTVENIKFEKNKITQVKGNMFDDKSGVSVNLQTEFDGKIGFSF